MKIKNIFSYINKDRNHADLSRLLQTCSSVMHDTVEIAIYILVVVFPLFYHNGYYDILETKFQFYSLCIIALCGVLFLLSLFMLGVDLKCFRGLHLRHLLSGLHPYNWKNTFCTADFMILGFWITAGISTLLSKYTHEAFWGNTGRYSGFFLLSLYVIAYFLISRLWTLKGMPLDAFLAAGMIVCFLGITDYFQIDILNMKQARTVSLTSFTSTFGNINTYTAYVGMLTGLAAAMFATAKTTGKLIYYYFCVFVSFIALILGRSDNTYLSLATIFILLPFILFDTEKGIQKYILLLATFLTAIWGIHLATLWFAGNLPETFEISGLFRMIMDLRILPFLLFLLWALVIILEVICQKQSKNNIAFKKQEINFVHLWFGLMVISLFILCFILFDANRGQHSERYDALSNYLIFNDNWGSNRGYIWRKSLWLYHKFTPLQKLFGYGPDTLGMLVNKTLVFQSQNQLGSVFDNAHNAFLQYLLTIGLLGMVFYLLFLGNAFRKLFENRNKNPYILGILIAVACYAVQSLVNLDLPIVTPIMWLLVSMGISGCRKSK